MTPLDYLSQTYSCIGNIKAGEKIEITPNDKVLISYGNAKNLTRYVQSLSRIFSKMWGWQASQEATVEFLEKMRLATHSALDQPGHSDNTLNRLHSRLEKAKCGLINLQTSYKSKEISKLDQEIREVELLAERVLRLTTLRDDVLEEFFDGEASMIDSVCNLAKSVYNGAYWKNPMEGVVPQLSGYCLSRDGRYNLIAGYDAIRNNGRFSQSSLAAVALMHQQLSVQYDLTFTHGVISLDKPLLKNLFTSILKEWRASNNRFLAIPLVSGRLLRSHVTLLFLDKNSTCIEFYDSKGGHPRDYLWDLWNGADFVRLLQEVTRFPLTHALSTKHQQDFYNCGTYIAYYCQRRSEGHSASDFADLPIVDHAAIMIYRKELALGIYQAVVEEQTSCRDIQEADTYPDACVLPEDKEEQKNRDFGSYVKSYCPGYAIEKAEILVEEGRRFYQQIIQNKQELIPTEERCQKMIAFTWYLMADAVQRGEGFLEGLFVINDPEFRILQFFQPAAYPRWSSHYQERAKEQYGIKTPGLPAKHGTVLFGALTSYNRSETIFLKPEAYGFNIHGGLSDLLESLLHGLDFVRTRPQHLLPSLFGLHGLDNIRKEHTDPALMRAYIKLIEKISKKPSENDLEALNQFGIAEMNRVLNNFLRLELDKESQVLIVQFLDSLQKQYGNNIDQRKGKEVYFGT